MKTVAVDWSGRKGPAQRKHLWAATVIDDQLAECSVGRSREELIEWIISLGRGPDRLVVGIDFAFAFPAWFAHTNGCETARQVWRLAADRGEAWLHDCETPFWGRSGRPRPELPAHYRGTEGAVREITGASPRSVFQIGGAGAVGTGSIRGMPHLAVLRDAGFAIWPFDERGPHTVVEIYPRVLTGPVRKSSARARSDYLATHCPELASRVAATAASTEDAFDAAVSALVMGAHADDLDALERSADPVTAIEGEIWLPPRVACAARARSR